MIGTDTYIDRLLGRFFAYQEDQTITDELLEDETNALLAAILLSVSDEQLEDGSESVDETADYYADSFTVTSDGPAESKQNVDGKRLDLGFIAGKIDLRFTDDIAVAFKRPNRPNRDISYPASLSPVEEIPAGTRYVWISRGENASSDPTVQLEAWP